MKPIRKASVLAALILFGAACAELDVVNDNDADAGRALETAGDIESLIAGSYRQWWLPASEAAGFGAALSNMAWQHSGWPANFGVVFFSGIPRPATTNDPAANYYGNMVYTWNQSYRALSAAASGLQAIDESPEIQEELGSDGVARARAFGKFVQGLAHGAIGLFYDQGFIVDESNAFFDEAGNVIPQDITDRQTVMENAYAYFEEAIALSRGQSWPNTPTSWASVAISPDLLAQLAHSTRARYRAAFARTPEERAAVDWNAVIADIDNGVTETWSMDVPRGGDPWDVGIYNQYFGAAWQQLSYQVAGMADQSGMYQAWIAIDPSQRLPEIGGEPFLIITDDTRFPQGATLEEQAANPGTLYNIPVTDDGSPTLGNHFQRPDRGTMRWSYYWANTMRSWGDGDGFVAIVSTEEMDLLRAEALYRLGGNSMTAEAAELVNRTRMAAGLDDISDGVNDSCVPKLVTGECGDFFEALKWEKRLETLFSPGLYFAPWYFEGRGWGDLYTNTPLELPAPCLELQLIPSSCYDLGGIGGVSAASTSVYAWPHEG